MLVIRFSRVGKKNQPSFKIVVTDKRNPPKAGRFVEQVGFYNPLTKEKILKNERIKYWLSVGAKPSDTVYNLLVSEKVIEGNKIPLHKTKKPSTAPASAEAPADASSFAKAPSDAKALEGKSVDKEAIADKKAAVDKKAMALPSGALNDSEGRRGEDKEKEKEPKAEEKKPEEEKQEKSIPPQEEKIKKEEKKTEEKPKEAGEEQVKKEKPEEKPAE